MRDNVYYGLTIDAFHSGSFALGFVNSRECSLQFIVVPFSFGIAVTATLIPRFYLEAARRRATGSNTAKAMEPRYRAFLNTAGLIRSSVFFLGSTFKFKDVMVVEKTMGVPEMGVVVEDRRRVVPRAFVEPLTVVVKAAESETERARTTKTTAIVANRRYMMSGVNNVGAVDLSFAENKVV